jgi:hypothetical protein
VRYLQSFVLFWVTNTSTAPFTVASHCRMYVTVRGYCCPVVGFHGHQCGSFSFGGTAESDSDRREDRRATTGVEYLRPVTTRTPHTHP